MYNGQRYSGVYLSHVFTTKKGNDFNQCLLFPMHSSLHSHSVPEDSPVLRSLIGEAERESKSRKLISVNSLSLVSGII